MGRAHRHATDATAFGLRQQHFLMEIVAAWDPNATEDTPSITNGSPTCFHPCAAALPGGYPNFLTSEDREQLGSAYGHNAARLRDLKRRYDPENVFSSAIPIPD